MGMLWRSFEINAKFNSIITVYYSITIESISNIRKSYKRIALEYEITYTVDPGQFAFERISGISVSAYLGPPICSSQWFIQIVFLVLSICVFYGFNHDVQLIAIYIGQWGLTLYFNLTDN